MSVCQTSIRRFDGDASSTLHAAVFGRGASRLRFVAWVTIDKGTGLYVKANAAPSVLLAWIPQERVTDESSSPTQIDAALANPDHVPVLVVPRQQQPWAWISDHGSPFPAIQIKGTAMVLALRVESIEPGTHGQFTFGWAGATS